MRNKISFFMIRNVDMADYESLNINVFNVNKYMHRLYCVNLWGNCETRLNTWAICTGKDLQPSRVNNNQVLIVPQQRLSLQLNLCLQHLELIKASFCSTDRKAQHDKAEINLKWQSKGGMCCCTLQSQTHNKEMHCKQ